MQLSAYPYPTSQWYSCEKSTEGLSAPTVKPCEISHLIKIWNPGKFFFFFFLGVSMFGITIENWNKYKERSEKTNSIFNKALFVKVQSLTFHQEFIFFSNNSLDCLDLRSKPALLQCLRTSKCSFFLIRLSYRRWKHDKKLQKLSNKNVY